MDSTFRGRFDAKLDAKGRLCLPPSFRQQLPKANSSIVVTNSQYQGKPCLDVYMFKRWQELEKRIEKMSPLKAEVQAFQRFYMSGGQVVDTDKMNRVLVPLGLRNYASLKTEVVLVGMGHKFEIWPAEVWTKMFVGLASGFESTMAAVANLDEDS